MDTRPVVVAFDGSKQAEAAVREAVALLPGRRLVVVSAWEPGLAVAMAPAFDPTGIGYASPNIEDMATLDRAQRDHALDAAEAGARLARELGADAEPRAAADESDVPGTIAQVAEELDACAIVVGSRGLGAVKSKLLGSTSSGLLHRTRRPVLVVRGSDE